jgi:ribonucleoside-triphosphate reductase
MKVTKIEKKEKEFTLDIEVGGTHTYQLGNGMVSHNTSSLVLGTSSGIHSWHNDFYIRRIRVGKNESIYNYLINNHPELVDDEFFKPNIQAVIEVPQKAPEGAVTRQESALDLLKRVSKVWKEWVKPGHRKGANRNNVSTTVTIKPDEWQEVGEWMWENRDNFTALSVLPFDGGSYIQAPFEDITEEEYNERVKILHNINLDDVVEFSDDTNLQGEAACSSNGCEVS